VSPSIVLAELRWPILERIHLGPVAVSPHGIAIALGFLAGAQLLLRGAQRRGVVRRPLTAGEPDVAETISALLTRAALGAIVGARFFYVVTRPEIFEDPASWFRVWEGGLSLLGGITGAVLGGLPYVLRRKLSVPLVLDSVAPGLALGIVVGRIGDLIIGEHLGGRTSFILGWRCTGQFDDASAPYAWPGPTVQGCFDASLHQTALYDFLAAGVVLGALLLLARKPRPDGFFLAAFAILYGAGRFVTDFARTADIDLVGPLTGSQVTSLIAILAAVGYLVVARPDRRRPWAWSPPDFPHGWGRSTARHESPDAGEPLDDQPPDQPLSTTPGRTGGESG
jgi:phosphatidylglycerol:prolipoprotein diacylglycerol transferase